jgi:hypothetical protein
MTFPKFQFLRTSTSPEKEAQFLWAQNRKVEREFNITLYEKPWYGSQDPNRAVPVKIRHTKSGELRGIDSQGFTINIINSILKDNGYDFSISDPQVNNPAYTIGGSAHWYTCFLDQIIEPSDVPYDYGPLVGCEKAWGAFTIEQNDVLSILKKAGLFELFGGIPFFVSAELQRTKKILFI